MFCPICAATHDSCISDDAVQASICHCGKSIPAIHNHVCRILSFLWSLEGPTYGSSSDCPVFIHGPLSHTCNVRFYTIMLQAEMSIHQQLVTKCKPTFLQCLNIESSTNGLPPCHKIINASLCGQKDSLHISTSMAFFFRYIIWCYSKHWHFVLGLER